jgi:subtilisin family serine protease
VDETLTKATFSNYAIGKISLGAPGVRVWSTWPGGTYLPASGTSMAAPHAAGVAALIASRHPWWGADRIKKTLFATVTPAPCPADYPAVQDCTTAGGQTSFYGHGIVNAAKAVS